MNGLTDGLIEDTEAIKALSDANKELVGVISSVVAENRRYEQSDIDLRIAQNDLFIEKDKLINAGYREESKVVQEVNAKLAENQAKMSQLQKRLYKIQTTPIVKNFSYKPCVEQV